MSWIWQDYSIDNKYYIKDRFSAYSETFIDENSKNISFNPWLRFTEIFIDSVNNEVSLKELQWLLQHQEVINAIVHYLAQCDLLNGMSYIEIVKDLIYSEILNGTYGEKIKSLFILLNEKDQSKIVEYLYEYHNQKEKTSIFNQVFLEMFKYDDDTIFYYDSLNSCNTKKEELLLGFVENNPEIYYNSYNMITYCYCGSQDTIYNRNKFNLIKLLFANVDDNIKDIWGNCFGIIGECRKYVSSYPVIGKSAMINIY